MGRGEEKTGGREKPALLADAFEAVIAAVKSRHSYTNPALVVIPLDGGSADYIAWLLESTEEAK